MELVPRGKALGRRRAHGAHGAHRCDVDRRWIRSENDQVVEGDEDAASGVR